MQYKFSGFGKLARRIGGSSVNDSKLHKRTFFRYRDAPPGLKPIIVHKFILANNSADSVHVFTFKGPADSWEENWAKYGTPILSKVNILPNVSPN